MAGVARRAPVLAVRILGVICVAGVAGAAVAASWVEEYPELGARTTASCKAGQLAECRSGLERLLLMLDGRPDIECRLARATASLGDDGAALGHLRLCAASGLEVADPENDPAFRSLRTQLPFAEAERTYRHFRRPAGAFERRVELDDASLVAEDMAYDPADRSFLISSVRARKIVRVARSGAVSDAWRPARPDVWGVFALVLDPARKTLWASTSAGAESPPFDAVDRGRSALLKLDARSYSVMARYELDTPGPHGFGDMTLGDRGEIYVSDGFGGGVYTVDDEPQPHLRAVVPPGKLRSPQTPALIAGRRELLVPDYSRGIAVIDLSSGALRWLAHPPELALYGIDGMYLRGRTLIAIQNGTAPERILVMRLDAGCSGIESWRVALARAPGLGDPTHGVFVGDRFVFLANSGWDRMSEDGTLAASPGERPPAVWELKLRAGEGSSQVRCRAPVR